MHKFLRLKKIKEPSSQPLTQRKLNSHSLSTPYTKVNQKWVLQGTHTIQWDQNLFHQFSDILCEDMEGPTGMKPCTQNEESLYIYPQESNVGSFWLPCNAPLAVQFWIYLPGHILTHLAYCLCDALLQLTQRRMLETGEHTLHCSQISEDWNLQSCHHSFLYFYNISSDLSRRFWPGYI